MQLTVDSMTGLHGQVAVPHALGNDHEAVQTQHHFMEAMVAQEKSNKKSPVVMLIVMFPLYYLNDCAFLF